MRTCEYEALLNEISGMCDDEDRGKLKGIVQDEKIVHDRIIEIIAYDTKYSEVIYKDIQQKYKKFIQALMCIYKGSYPKDIWERWAVEYLLRHTRKIWISELLSHASNPIHKL